jgi:hypothetical protein
MRPELDEIELRAMVHGAIGAIQSILQHRGTGLAPERTSVLLAAMGHAVLGIPASTDQSGASATEPSRPSRGALLG